MYKMIAIPVKTAIEYGEDTNAMFSLLSELREMLMTETRLKKHHRPYLHLREQIDEIHAFGGKVICSYHEFDRMLAPEEILGRIHIMQAAGADVFKIAARTARKTAGCAKTRPATTVTAKPRRTRKIPSPFPKRSTTSWWRIC